MIEPPTEEHPQLSANGLPPRPEPVFDPSIPARDMEWLRRPGTPLIPAGQPVPAWSRLPAPKAKALFHALLNLQIFALFAMVLLTVIVTALFGHGAAGLGPTLTALADVALSGWMVKAALTEPTGRKVARRHHGRYLLPADLDPESAHLLARAQSACRTVLAAEATRQGMLDQIDNRLTLPQVVWEIAQTLRTQTVLRAEQQQAATGLMTPELHAVLVPQRAALARSLAAVGERVDRVETYARLVQEADAAYQAQRLLESNGKYHELLARTGDEQGLAELTLRARALQETLARSVQDAIDTGRTLAL